MDPDRFDRLSKAVFHAGTRRQLLGLLTTAPVLASLTVLLGPEETEAEHPANRVLQHKEQRRHKARQERRKNRHQKQQDQNQNNNNGGGGSGGGGGDAPGGLGAGTCVPLDQLCNVASPIRCCGESFCFPTADPFISVCHRGCSSTETCQSEFGPDVECVRDFGVCTLSLCCRPTVCTSNGDCQGGGPCCGTLPFGEKRCCAAGQVCATFGGCATR